MGSDKLTAMLGDRPVIAHVADAVAAAGLPPPIVVLRDEASPVRDALAGYAAQFVVARDADQGMGRSIAAGIGAIAPQWDAAFICLGDMPCVSPALLAKLAERASWTCIVVPTWQGQRGNPVLWGRAHFPALMALEGDRGARDLIARAGDRVERIESPDDGVLRDVDTPEALQGMRDRLA